MNNAMIDGITNIDEDLIVNYFRTKEKLKNRLKNEKKVNLSRFSAIAACLCVIIALSAIIIPPYIPTKYSLNYSYVGENGKEIFIPDSNIWVYYVEDGEVERERVKLPSTPKNVFITWKYLNNIGEEVSLIKCEVIGDGIESVLTYDGNKVYEHGQNNVFTLNIIVSKNLNNYIDEANRDVLVDSLKKSISNCSNIKFESVNLILQDAD